MAAAEKMAIDHLDLWTAAIKRKSTAGRGSASKVELYGIKKLRELILDMAVRGLLVPQVPHDEPASALLNRIAAEKAKLVKEGKIKKQKPLSPIGDKEKSFELPHGWSWTKLEMLMEMFNGRAFKQTEWATTGLPIIRIQNLNDCTAPFNFFNGALSDAHRVEAGTFLISWSGTPGTSFGAFIWNRETGALNQHINKCLIFGDEISKEYLRLAVNSCMDHLIENAQGGVGLKHVTKGTLNNLVFALPPLSEQHRIVAKFGELMALCDQLEQQTDASLSAHQALVETLLNAMTSAACHEQFTSAWQRIAVHFDTLFTTEPSIDQLKQTILQLAVSGKLVSQEPNDEPASELLNKFAAEKANLVKEGKVKKEKPLPPIGDEETPIDLPKGWAIARLGEVIKISSGDGLTSAQMAPDGNIPVYGGNGVNGYHDKANVNNPTLVIGRVGFYCGSIHITPPKAWVTDNAFITSFPEELFTIQYLALLLKGTDLKENENATAQPVISGKKVYPIPVCFPPVKEQHRIVAKVDELMTLCNHIKARLSGVQITQLHLADAMAEQALMR